MPSITRMIMIVLVAVVVSLALVLLVTSRQVRDSEVVGSYAALVAQDKAAMVVGPKGKRLVEPKPIVGTVQWVSGTLGLGKKTAGVEVPPHWLMAFAVTWDRADVYRWWWVPLLLIGVRKLIGNFARKRVRR